MSRKVWQGDVLFFIKKSVPHTRNIDFLDLYKTINNGAELPPARISEILNAIKNGRTGNLGRDEFVEKEEVFYDRFFATKDLDIICHKLDLFLKEEELDFPRRPDETDKEYILRFLKYGLAETNVPAPYVGLTVVSSDQAITVLGGGLLPDSEEVIPDSEGNLPGSARVVPDSETAVSVSKNAAKKAEGSTASKKTETRSDLLLQQKIRIFFHRNWLVLVCGASLALGLFLYMSSTRTSIVDVFLGVFTMPTRTLIFLIFLLAVLPKAIGMAEAYWMYLRYRSKTDQRTRADCQSKTHHSESFVKIAKFGTTDMVLPGKGVFDSGEVNLQYGLLSNLTGALCTAAFYVFSSRLHGTADYSMADFIRSHPLNGFLALLILASVSICMIWDFLLQMRPAPEVPDEVIENPDNYLLNRLHVLATIVHLMFTMVFDGTIILYMFWFGFENRHLHLSLDVSFIGIIGSIFLYLWVASVSPHAKALNVDCYWLIHFTPLMSLLTLTYAVWFFSWSGITVLCIMANLFCLLIWLYYLKKSGSITFSV